MNLKTAFEDNLYTSYTNFREASLQLRRFKQDSVIDLIEKRRDNPAYEIKQTGESFEGRPIHYIKTGTGPRKILLWSQMHGDEPTATMAIFDILNFLEGKGDGFDEARKLLLTETTLYFVPMLNPDGAERYQRRNAQNIDINRDALHLQAPESRILKELQQNLQPEFGFNLHDKNPRYSVGNTSKLATISFLATAYDHEKNINPVREKAIQVITGMNRMLQKYIPNQVGKWNEDHEPRAFGDNIQKWGTTLILIESGGYVGDPEKQYIRKLNFMAILSGLYSITENSYVQEGRDEYLALPENSRYIYDLLIKNVTVNLDGKIFQADFGIDRSEVNYANASKFFYHSKIEEYGDLSIFFGSEEFDGSGYKLEKGKVLSVDYDNVSDLDTVDPWALLKEGYTFIKMNPDFTSSGVSVTALPLHILRNKPEPTGAPTFEDTATFTLTKNGEVKFAVVNGFIYDLSAENPVFFNGIVE
ncbi:Zinc carboxypeptidase [Dyadobacter koreensis]|uniref:Zinc carboxypeptidase n=1 Tax=Dyadobacter koreensis TaxID=408657 RepID=A0A1H7AHV5_9BACT|nr:M14 family zinc carboxypeptidase [Dyadobacter koreensis]SEJ61500.1 Zinc carboxypeptidase [Dyadobacter koreensis]